ncbi:MAG: nucleoside triphosphate pyrophosphohydrolase [Candidatus Tectomicrobia bacterium]|nr:nucleoside triphosphate pyrophosphohydrolase [Candidatus Tectomicrobia bacterium]
MTERPQQGGAEETGSGQRQEVPAAAAAEGAAPGRLFEDLLGIMERLRSPQGCPWDREQTAASIKPYLLEEAHEVLDALESGDARSTAEELGDLLFQIVFHAQLGREAGRFDMTEVLREACDKMVRRHPHVFGQGSRLHSADEVLVRWEELKRREREAERRTGGAAAGGAAVSALDGVPRTLPGLLRAQRLQEKARRGGFDWPDRGGVLAKVEEEWEELRERLAQGTHADREAEFGDLLFSLVNLARWLRFNAEEALRGATRRFEARFRAVEEEFARDGRRLEDASPADLDARWEAVKRRQRAAAPQQEGSPPGLT